MNEFHTNLWAPWRMEYIHRLSDDTPSCFLCDYRDAPGKDVENHVVWRGGDCLVVLNRFPYTNGHLLIAPLEHLGDLDEFSERQMNALWQSVRDAKHLLTNAIAPQGFNIGINLGRCAGAGLPGHLHVHVVPRWNGDTNFMAVLGDIRVIPQALDRLAAQLRQQVDALGITGSPTQPEG